jgi:DNA invertase Pin-like site-specific DNA recombinase
MSPARTGDLIGYARVSTHDQNLGLQIDALRAAGCTRIFEEHASGTKTDRPELSAALAYMREGDTLVAWRLDRLGRSLPHLLATVADLEERGIGFQSVHEKIDTTTTTGRFVLAIFGALAALERDLIVDRTKAGLAAARARGAKPGRKPSLSAKQVEVARTMHAGGNSVSAISQVLGVSRATIYRAMAPVSHVTRP